MKQTYSLVVALLAAAATTVDAATSAEWRTRSIYQIMTDRFATTDGSTTTTCNTEDRVYCGGTYQGIINHLDYIQNMGFTAIWISPIVKNLEGDTDDGEAYHSYWQQDLYALNEHFGNASDLLALATALHDRDMYLMVDVVANDMAWNGSPDTVDYSVFNPFNSADYYHSYCTIDYDDQDSVEDCWLGDTVVPLVDVKTEDSTVASMYQTWIAELVSNYSIDGLRIDTAKHVDQAFWPGFESAAGVFATGEVLDGDPAYTCPYQNYLSSVLNYPIYYQLIAAFESTSGDISTLYNMINTVKSDCKDTSLLGSFSENHDVTRFASLTDDLSLAKNVLTYNFLSDGIPIVFQGQEQRYTGSADPENRGALWFSDYNTDADLYVLITALNQIRAAAIAADDTWTTYMNYPIYSDDTTLVTRKGYDGKQIIMVLSNKGANGDSYTLSLSGTGYDANAAVTETISCTSATVGSDGVLDVPMVSGLPRAYYPTSELSGSGVCGL